MFEQALHILSYICFFIRYLFSIDFSWITSLSPFFLLLIGSFVGYLFKGHLQRRASKTEVINKLIDSIESTSTEMRKQAFRLLKSNDNGTTEITHHIFVALNTKLKRLCEDITHHDSKNYKQIPNKELKELRQACDEIIENHSDASVYGALITKQSDLQAYYRYVVTN
ncbi:hypothetical protein [Pseudoalteromonas sp. Z1A8]|uniref:hypothetical protein n=1 Tax=Pseudoalteromonas sp. Z1A8 TaxID=2686354 RepID=UPI00140B5467|nr:hypothetical protein [Pseudoalteromonas sp. Z1A8]